MKIKRPHQYYITTNFRQNPFSIQNSKILIKNEIYVHYRKLFTIVNNLRAGKESQALLGKKLSKI